MSNNNNIQFNFDAFNPNYKPSQKKDSVIENKDEEVKGNDMFSLGSEIEEELKIEKEINHSQIQKKAFEGANKAVLETEIVDDSKNTIITSIPTAGKEVKMDLADINIPVKNSIDHLVEAEIEKEKQLLTEDTSTTEIMREEPSHVESRPAKVICVGGNEEFFRNTLVNLKEDYPDVEFIKYIFGGGKSTLYTIDTMKPDIILIYHKAQIQNALQFYQTICNEVDDKNIPYKEKYIDKRIIVIAPNDLAYEMQMRGNGIEFFVNETNSKTHEVDVENLISQIRLAVADINDKKMLREKIKTQNQHCEQLTIDCNENDLHQEIMPTGDIEIEDDLIPETPEKIVESKNIARIKKKEISISKPDGGKIIGVYSATGGAGKTTFATNLSAILSKYSNLNTPNNYKVALVEYNFACQNIDLFFNIKTEKNLCGLAQESLDFIDENNNIPETTMRTLIKKHMYKDEVSDLDILLGISVPLEIDKISSKFTNTLFDTLKKMYDVVVVDLSTDIAKPQVLNAFNKCDELYYIMPMDVTSIRNTKVMINFFTGSIFRMPVNKIKVILNKVNINNKEFGVDQVYSALASTECVPEGTIPDAGEDVLSSINRGIPIAIENLENPVSQAIYSIAVGVNPMLNDSLLLGETKKENKKGFLGNIFSKNKKSKKEKENIKKTKSSLFSNKKSKLLSNPPTITEPIITKEQKNNVEKKSLFGKKKTDNNIKELSTIPLNEPIKEKSGFLTRFFGKKNKPEELEVNVKTKKKSLGNIFSKKQVDNGFEKESLNSDVQNSRLKPLIPRQPLKKE